MKTLFEYTDTFGGEANYSWVRRLEIKGEHELTDRQLVFRAKKWAGLTGVRCDTSSYFDMIEVRPRNMCRVIFITFQY